MSFLQMIVLKLMKVKTPVWLEVMNVVKDKEGTNYFLLYLELLSFLFEL